MKKSTKKQKLYKLSLPVLLVAIVVVFFLLPLIPPSEERKERCIADLEYERCYALVIDGKPTLFLNDLNQGSLTTSVATHRDSVYWSHTFLKGCWIKKNIAFPYSRGRMVTENPDYSSDSLLTSLNDHIGDVIDNNINLLETECKRMKRIVRQIEYYLDVHNVNDEGYNAIASLAEKVIDARHNRERTLAILKSLKPHQRVELKQLQRYTLLYKDTTGTVRRHPCTILDDTYGQRLCYLQTERHFMPDSAQAIYHHILTSDYVNKIIRTHPQPLPKGGEFDILPANESNQNPSLGEGHRVGSTIHYQGELADGKRNGHGILIDNARIEYYDGMWENDKRNGFGFAVDSLGKFRIGEWNDDQYKGERLVYTNERIYGIDISRYQHDIGKKHYAINWDNIRITHLGTISKKRVEGNIDYPVSFVYIKCSEGISILNRYYKADYAAARKRGMHVGSYHFFSTKTNATQQANHFLANARIQQGDFPPVLDLEPYPSQIKEMGGAEVMFDRVRTWLQIVEKRTGMKPILYVNQMFVNNYLPLARDIMRNYRVWIARYGEYKPDVRLVFWQLSPDGRVAGIRGDVDINVFNGYKDQWDNFLNSLEPQHTDTLAAVIGQ